MTYTELLPAADATPANPLWHKLRAAGIGSSEIAAVLGISPWDSPFSLYWQKVNGWSTPDNPEMAAGRRAEQVVADWYLEVADPLENTVLERAGLYASDARPWQLATPDRLIYSQCDACDGNGFEPDGLICGHCKGSLVDGPLLGLLECKYVIGGWDGWGETGTDEVPVHYRAQALWQADVLDASEVFIAAWHGADLRVFRIHRDERDLHVMRTAGERFMHRLAVGDIPDVDGHNETIRALKTLHPSIEDRKEEVTQVTADGYRRARALKARTAATADLWEARLRAEMGNARRAVSPEGVFVASRSIYELGGEDYELHALDGVAPLVDKLNPARSKK